MNAPLGRMRRGRAIKDKLFLALCVACAALAVGVLVALLASVFRQGWAYFDWQFLTSYPSRVPAKAGIKAAIWGSIATCLVAAAAAIPLGIATAVFLEEYKPRRRFFKRVHGFVQLNITNLAGVPSIVYGILGLTVFVRMFGLFGSPNPAAYDDVLQVTTREGEVVQGEFHDQTEDAIFIDVPLRGRVEVPLAHVVEQDHLYVRWHVFELAAGGKVRGKVDDVIEDGSVLLRTTAGETVAIAPASVASYRTVNMIQFGDEDSFFYFRLPLGPSILAGGLTLALVILPIMIVASREALRAVPDSLRDGALALGATRWQTIRCTVLPAAMPGFMTGSILAMSRAIGEAAPLLIVGGVLFILFTPRNLMDTFAALPLQIFNWAGRPQAEFHSVAAAGIIALLILLFLLNLAAVLIRQKFQKPLQ